MATEFQTRPNVPQERSLGELFADLTRDTTTLVRQELNLAKTEMTQKAASVGKDVGMIAAGGAVAYAGLIILLFAFAAILDVFLPWWAATLIVALVAMGAGGFVALQGLNKLRKVDPVPRQTVETLKEDLQAVKGQH